MPAGQYVLDLIESANEGMPARLVYSARSQRLRMLVCEELRKLSRSVDQNFPVWMGVFATQQIAKLIICYDPLDEYAKENTERILNATASAVKKVLYHNYGHRVYNDNSDEIVEILHEISRQNPHNGHLQSLVGRTLKTMVEGMKSEMDEQTLTEQIERKLRSSIDDDDSYDHCTESSSVDIPSDSTF
ncbi:hypothetical protein N7457_001779 [Penicillium paradoxum]|uniref:uncharacterized protein n=1 Tax=Penicillium paradoxum TaxID=176176 RepID=UPI0025493AA7|nr:uncharacterized protein N7457_001779 [Penicillium paradoxum]KAJ5795180.1 hypothetical protein N7457_001779 [Penicillium paradoxum]